jgi:hypothetical protein
MNIENTISSSDNENPTRHGKLVRTLTSCPKESANHMIDLPHVNTHPQVKMHPDFTHIDLVADEREKTGMDTALLELVKRPATPERVALVEELLKEETGAAKNKNFSNFGATVREPVKPADFVPIRKDYGSNETFAAFEKRKKKHEAEKKKQPSLEGKVAWEVAEVVGYPAEMVQRMKAKTPKLSASAKEKAEKNAKKSDKKKTGNSEASGKKKAPAKAVKKEPAKAVKKSAAKAVKKAVKK